jgi:hypothetical protein
VRQRAYTSGSSSNNTTSGQHTHHAAGVNEVKASAADAQEAREARLKRFEELAVAEAERRRKETYAEAMASAMGTTPSDVRQRLNAQK